MSEFKMSGLDRKASMDMQRKNIEMIASIHQILIDNLHAFTQGQIELTLNGIEKTTNPMNTRMSAQRVQEKFMSQAEKPR